MKTIENKQTLKSNGLVKIIATIAIPVTLFIGCGGGKGDNNPAGPGNPAPNPTHTPTTYYSPTITPTFTQTYTPVSTGGIPTEDTPSCTITIPVTYTPTVTPP